jgi:hypothetical protein
MVFNPCLHWLYIRKGKGAQEGDGRIKTTGLFALAEWAASLLDNKCKHHKAWDVPISFSYLILLSIPTESPPL